MNNNTACEYWDAELKTQSKKRLAMLEQAIKQTGAIITDRYEDKFFKDPKLLWRNPLLLKVKLPRGKRWEFILASKCTVWLAAPPKIGIPKPLNRYVRRGDPTAYCAGYCDPPPVLLRGDHDNLQLRRRYRIHPTQAAYIADYKPELDGGREIIEGIDILAAVLDGDLDLIL